LAACRGSSPDNSNSASARFGHALRGGGRRRQQPGMAHPLIKWAELRYYANATSADGVSRACERVRCC